MMQSLTFIVIMFQNSSSGKWSAFVNILKTKEAKSLLMWAEKLQKCSSVQSDDKAARFAIGAAAT